MSEHEGSLDDCENHEANVGVLDENSNDENDVDDETMSGKQIIIIWVPSRPKIMRIGCYWNLR